MTAQTTDSLARKRAAADIARGVATLVSADIEIADVLRPAVKRGVEQANAARTLRAHPSAIGQTLVCTARLDDSVCLSDQFTVVTGTDDSIRIECVECGASYLMLRPATRPPKSETMRVQILNLRWRERRMGNKHLLKPFTQWIEISKYCAVCGGERRAYLPSKDAEIKLALSRGQATDIISRQPVWHRFNNPCGHVENPYVLWLEAGQP